MGTFIPIAKNNFMYSAAETSVQGVTQPLILSMSLFSLNVVKQANISQTYPTDLTGRIYFSFHLAGFSAINQQSSPCAKHNL